MNLYKCYIAIDGWSSIYLDHVEYLWAVNEEEAKSRYCKMYSFRRNKQGLTVENIEHKVAERTSKVCNELVTKTVYNYWLGSYSEQTYEDVTHYYCSSCGKEVLRGTRYCTCCNSELLDSEAVND